MAYSLILFYLSITARIVFDYYLFQFFKNIK